MKPINIIGAGMAGSILAKLLRKEGIEFRIFDQRHHGAASRISENLIGLNWYQDKKEEVREALDILKSIVPVRVIEAGKNTCHHVYREDLLEPEENTIYGTARPFGNDIEVTYTDAGSPAPRRIFDGFTVWCTGVWTGHALPNINVESVVGHGLQCKGQLEKEVILPYKPFRLLKSINAQKDLSWFSNSLAVNNSTYWKNEQKYRDELFADVDKIPNLSEQGAFWYVYGYRPKFHNNHSNVMVPNGMVITGGYKSGMLYYPLQAKRAVEWIKDQARFL